MVTVYFIIMYNNLFKTKMLTLSTFGGLVRYSEIIDNSDS